MDDNTLKQTLRAIGQEAVPDNWDRWHEIRQRVEDDAVFSRRAVPQNLWLKRVAALLIVMLISSGAIYAFVQLPPPPTGDTGIDGVKDAGLVTDLNLVQTVDDVQVQLNWAYIDEGRAILNYQTFLVNEDGTRRAADADEPAVVRLSGHDGALRDLYPNRIDSESWPKPITVAFNLVDQKASLPGQSNRIGLRFEIAYTQRPVIRNAIERIFFSEIRRSTFGWAKNGVRAPLPPEAISFTFDFTLPIQRAVTLEPMLTVIANQVPMTLKRVSVAPSQTNVNFCFELPESESRFWYPEDVTLAINGIKHSLGGGESRPGHEGEYCTKYSFENFARLPATVILTVQGLEQRPLGSVDEYLSIQREMAKRGIEMRVDVNPDGTLGGFTWPNHTEEARAVLAEIGFWIEGPWVFTIEVPAPDAK
jgi:hypothetical protein